MDEMDRTELDDQSMDEMYEMPEDLLEESVETLASPTKQASIDDEDDTFGRPIPRHSQAIAIESAIRTKQPEHYSNDSDDEPPEIPGSPMKPIIAPSYLKDGPKPDIFVVEHKDASESSSDEEYELDKQSTKDRAARIKTQRTAEYTPLTQESLPVLLNPQNSPPKPIAVDNKGFTEDIVEEDAQIEEHHEERTLPMEIQKMLEYVDLFKPEVLDIATFIEPFIPEYLPSIGFPYDATTPLRPDAFAKECDEDEQNLGISILAEPGATQSNPAELQLLLLSESKVASAQSRQALELPVHSIIDAHLCPQRIDAWIKSVGNIQQSQPLPHVMYTKPMPTLDQLLELWPVDLEPLIANLSQSSELKLSLSEYAMMVCVLLDIPVYAGHLKQSLHLLFTLYQECEAISNQIPYNGS
ncbi:hypothetical protein THRCLA_02142 [Thraustotheca clavata]|uniref:Intraflagellar transport protein 46 homolog n=1 Tax=Thraustotheca clavata TaxID=74557 RepID=A0A1W0A6G5_9STRA|nr:hypothetical protein THRCLA_02142 [Thraustotheca clavata]